MVETTSLAKYNFVGDVLEKIPGVNKVAKGDVANATIAATSFAGLDYFVDAKLRGFIAAHSRGYDINAPLTKSNTPGIKLLKKKDVAYGAAIALIAAKKNKRVAGFFAASLLLKRWLESRGAITMPNQTRIMSSGASGAGRTAAQTVTVVVPA